MMGPGWIKFYRKTWDEHPNITKTGAWVWLLSATEYKGKYRGKFLTTITSLAFHWCLSRRKTKNILDSWVEDMMITISALRRKDVDFWECTPPSIFAPGNVHENVHKGIEITVLNYEKYQQPYAENDQEDVHASGNSILKNKKEYSSAQAPTKDKKRKSKKKTSKTDPRFQEVVGFFYRKFETEFGRKYVGQDKDFAAVKRLLKKLGADELMKRMEEYLADREPFLLSNGHNLALLQTRINAYGKPNFGERSTKGPGYLEPTY